MLREVRTKAMLGFPQSEPHAVSGPFRTGKFGMIDAHEEERSCGEKIPYTDEQIANSLRQAELGTSVKNICRKLQRHLP